MLESAKILRRVLKIWGDFLSPKTSMKNHQLKMLWKNLQRVKIIMIIFLFYIHQFCLKSFDILFFQNQLFFLFFFLFFWDSHHKNLLFESLGFGFLVTKVFVSCEILVWLFSDPNSTQTDNQKEFISSLTFPAKVKNILKI